MLLRRSTRHSVHVRKWSRSCRRRRQKPDRSPIGTEPSTSAWCRSSRLKDIASVAFDPETPLAIVLTFTPDAEDRMERITGSRPSFPMAFVVDDDAVVNVVLEGGFGIGKGGLQVSVDKNEERIKENLRRTQPLCRSSKREVGVPRTCRQ